jgi:hypothetical protein
MFNSTLEIIIKARDEASQTMSNMSAKLKNMEPAFKKMAVAGTVAFGAIAGVAVTSFKAFADAQAQTEITNQSLQNTLDSMSKGALAKLQKDLGNTRSAFANVANASLEAGRAAVKMGFDDETAANSYAKLFAATKDATKAQKEVQIAMDLARYKGISLEEATQKLVMVHAGATKELKSLGLAVTDGATAMQNLDAIQKQVAGSAETFAGTAAGAMERIKVQTDNLKESIGAALAPAFDKVVAAVTPLLEKFAAWAEANPELLSKIILIGGAVAGLVAVVGTLGILLPSIIAGFTLLAGPVGLVIAAIGLLTLAVTKIIGIFTLLRDHSKEVWAGLKIMFKETIDSIVHFFDPLVNVIQKVENALARVGQGVANVAKSVGSKISNFFSGGKAQGGNVSSGSSYLVGERGPEIFTPGASGYVTPNNKIGGGGSNVVININGGQYLSEDAALDMGDKLYQALKMQMRGA